VARYCAANGLPLDGKVFSEEAISRLLSYHWPGNIRELESTVSRAALSAPGRVIRDGDIEFLHAHVKNAAPSSPGSPGLQTLREAERAHIERALALTEWNKKEAARILDISRGTLYRKILEYQLDPDAEVSRNNTEQ
jgi:DNA-binding NtrC family response regulator